MATQAIIEAPATPSQTVPGQTAVALSYLRAFVTLLVVAHHSAIVYMSMKIPHPASFTAQPRVWLMFPVADPAGWPGFDLFFAWNDTFFMSLMFLISGVFVWPSLRRHGASSFLRRRFLRVGLPFALSAALLGPLMYLPAYLQSPTHAGLAEYWKVWLSLGNWPSGPTWFLWVLLGFDCLAGLCYLIAPRVIESFATIMGGMGTRPLRFFVALVVLSQAAYLPLFWKFGPWAPIIFGPFLVQGSKLLVYLLYFFVGAGLGIYGIDTGLFQRAGRLARRWPVWGVASMLFFGAWLASNALKKDQFAAVLFSFTCAATSVFVIALFVRFVQRKNRIADNFSANSYGIYLLHYVILCWVQWVLLQFAAPAIVKGLTAFVCALALSWAASSLMRKIPGIARVI
ncbi:MAG: acyltransferase [Terracidiphilus sp.]|jgi:peptidoglycan/LPS O-acetylase OafA/YrhL